MNISATNLVTGGAGYIGSHFIETLLRETEPVIVGLDDFNGYYNLSQKRMNPVAFSGNERVEIIEHWFRQTTPGVAASI